MFGRDWGHALWLSAVAATVAVASLGCMALAVLLGTDADSRPDSGLEWTLYGWLLLLALVVCLVGMGTAIRLYRRAFELYLRGLRQTDRSRPSGPRP